ncbi:unnamed protein product, partial [Prorocentrum cordatum]
AGLPGLRSGVSRSFELCASADGMMRLRTSHSVGALLLLLAARGAPSAGSRSPASGALARPRLEGSASGRPREPQAEFGRRQATSGAQLLKLVASDGTEGDRFGIAVVSSDGARVVVGAFGDDDQGSGSGSVHVFDGTSGERLLKLVASDGAAYDGFGYAVAVGSDGARVVVGAYDDDDQGSGSGSVHVFDGASGERLLKLVASDGAGYDRFGISVAVSSDGARVVVGRPFGISVAVSSDGARVVVGANYDDDRGSKSGSGHVFDGISGERLLKLVASDGAEDDRFGISVAVSSDGARVVVGALGDDDRGDTSGSVRVFDGTSGERLLKLVASDGAAYDGFGFGLAVSSDGARVVVGATGDDDGSGSVHVFDGTSGERLLKLVASGGAAGDSFGCTVAVSSDGARVVVGVYYDDDQGADSGSVYVFDGTIVTT